MNADRPVTGTANHPSQLYGEDGTSEKEHIHRCEAEDMSVMLELAVDTARDAGRLLTAKRASGFRVESKGLRDFVTDADGAAQKLIQEAIRSRFPDHGFVGEEESGGSLADSDYIWIVDPLDGTTNYARGLPYYAVSVGLAYRGEPVIGAVYDPAQDQMFAAESGKGATLNGTPVHVSERKQLIDSIIAADWAREQRARESTARAANAIGPLALTFRSIGVAALGFCLVAAGWIEAYFHYCLYPWDAAAGVVIASEAGACCTDLSNRPWRPGSSQCLVSNGLLHEALLSLTSPFARHALEDAPTWSGPTPVSPDE